MTPSWQLTGRSTGGCPSHPRRGSRAVHLKCGCLLGNANSDPFGQPKVRFNTGAQSPSGAPGFCQYRRITGKLPFARANHQGVERSAAPLHLLYPSLSGKGGFGEFAATGLIMGSQTVAESFRQVASNHRPFGDTTPGRDRDGCRNPQGPTYTPDIGFSSIAVDSWSWGL